MSFSDICAKILEFFVTCEPKNVRIMADNMHFDQTICAPATIPGTGAISVIRISGKKAFEIVDSLIEFKNGTAAAAKGGSVKFGVIYGAPAARKILDEVLCCIFRAPLSYTGEDVAEIMCHASAYIVSEIIARLVALGCRIADPGEFTKRAYLNGKMDLSQAEAVADVISASTEHAHNAAFKQLKGGITNELAVLRGELLQMVSLLELELDFSEEDVEFANRKDLISLLRRTMEHIDRLASTFRLGNAIKNGVPVAIVGEPNCGKSTLLNAILGDERAIVSDIAGTTRDTIEETFNVDGILFRLIDTAGIHDNTNDEIEKIGMRRTFQTIEKSDIVVLLLDAVTLSNALGGLCDYLQNPASTLSTLLSEVNFESQNLIIALNKCDLVGEKGGNIFVNTSNIIVLHLKNEGIDEANLESHLHFAKISAKTGEGVRDMLKLMAESRKLILSDRDYSGVVVTNMRHYQALVTAHASLASAYTGLTQNTPSDLIAEDLRSALSTLGSITGEITTEEVLGNIFQNFCIGK